MDKYGDLGVPPLNGDRRDEEILTEELLDFAAESLLVLDSDLRVKAANKTFYESFNVRSREVLGRLLHEIATDPWHRPPLRDLLARVLASDGESQSLEFEQTLPETGGRRLRLTARKVAHRGSQRPLIFVAVLDVTECKRLADDLHASEERYRTLVDTAQDGVWTIDASGNTTFANRSMAAMLATTIEEMLGKPSFTYVFEEDLARAVDLFRNKVAGDREPFEFRLRRADGSWFWASVTGTPFHNASGETSGLLGTFRDITEYKLAEEAATRHADEFARSTADLQRFAYVTSHDLRVPLRTMRVYAQLLLRRYGGALDADADRFLKFIESAADRMDKLVHDLLTYSQATERDGSVAAEVDLKKTLSWAKMNIATRIADAGAEIEHAELPTVYGDELQLVQLFQHLLSNAIKFRRADQPPRVHISAELKNDEWLVAVSDNGIGIPRDRWDYVFGIFKRLHGPDIPGTGIGLAICRKVSENHGGKIWVSSEPGRGSTFFITIPAVHHRVGTPQCS